MGPSAEGCLWEALGRSLVLLWLVQNGPSFQRTHSWGPMLPISTPQSACCGSLPRKVSLYRSEFAAVTKSPRPQRLPLHLIAQCRVVGVEEAMPARSVVCMALPSSCKHTVSSLSSLFWPIHVLEHPSGWFLSNVFSLPFISTTYTYLCLSLLHPHA